MGKYLYINTFKKRQELFFIIMLCSLMLKESISTFVIILTLIHTLSFHEGRESFKLIFKNKVNYLPLIYFLPLVFSLFFEGYSEDWLKHFTRFITWLIIPFLFLSLRFTDKKVNNILSVFTISLTLIILYSISVSIYKGLGNNLYYELITLSRKIRFHSTLLAFFSLISIIKLVEKPKLFTYKLNLLTRILWIILLALVIILPQARIIILSLFGYLLFKLIRWIYLKFTNKLYPVLVGFVTFIVLLFYLASIPRFKQILNSDFSVPFKEKYTKNTNFNSTNVRLLNWRTSIQTLNTVPKALFGVGSHLALKERNKTEEKIGVIPYAKFGSDPKRISKFNSHNQYVETLLRGGIFQLVTLLFLLFLLLKKAFLLKNNVVIYALIIFTFFLITESVLVRSKGLLFFLLFSTIISQSKLPSKTSFNSI